MAVTLVALYVVSSKASREAFETDSAESKGLPSTSAAASAGTVDAADEERINGMVFKTFLEVFGVPPTVEHAKHYASVVKGEGLDESALQKRIESDKGKATQDLAAATTLEKPKKHSVDSFENPGEDKEAKPEMDADMQALREKAAEIAKMSGPVVKSAGKAASDQMAAKLRSIAGQVSDLARQYDVPLASDSDAPKGIESFISF